MTITFDNTDLFSSGPARVKVGGRSLRHATEHPLSSHAVHVFAQGLTGRALTQTGVLIADTPAELRDQIEAIEAKLDGMPHTLIDHLGRTWSSVVMQMFEPGEVVPLGTRWKVDYRIAYVQTDS